MAGLADYNVNLHFFYCIVNTMYFFKFLYFLCSLFYRVCGFNLAEIWLANMRFSLEQSINHRSNKMATGPSISQWRKIKTRVAGCYLCRSRWRGPRSVGIKIKLSSLSHDPTEIILIY